MSKAVKKAATAKAGDLAAQIKANLAQSSAHLHPTQNEVDSGETHKRRAAINEIIGGAPETPTSFLEAVKSGEIQPEPKQPTISIVTIFNKANAAADNVIYCCPPFMCFAAVSFILHRV